MTTRWKTCRDLLIDPGAVAGRRVVVVDDSLVRGTTSRKIVHMLRKVGAREVHMRIACPPTTHSCYYGIDTPTRGELIAANRDVAGIADFLQADSLGYLSLPGLMEAVASASSAGAPPRYCHACFSGEYPVPTVDEPPYATHLTERD